MLFSQALGSQKPTSILRTQNPEQQNGSKLAEPSTLQLQSQTQHYMFKCYLENETLT